MEVERETEKERVRGRRGREVCLNFINKKKLWRESGIYVEVEKDR